MKAKLINENFTENYVINLLKFYGIKDIENYLNPDFNMLQSPLNLDNIHEGYELLKSKCENNEHILIIVDSDVDGFTSAAIIYQYIKKIYPDIEISYLLHTGKQHGLQDHIDYLLENPIYGLVILPDSSSNDKEYHDQLAKFNISCLILDHHLTDVELSDNAVIINNQISSKYSNKDLTGAGIAYQFCRYLDKMYNVEYADYFIDLAALGINGDMGSLLDIENRYIIKTGFENIQNFFFKSLIEKQSFSMGGKVNPITVAFYIVPLINAMIRVGSMEEKDRLFRAFIDGTVMVPSNKRGAKGTEELLAVESARECTNARARQNRDLDKIMELLEIKIHKLGLLENKILFVELDEENFPSELNGLSAMKLAAKYKKPTLIGRVNNEGEIKGSIRNVNNCGLESLKDFLTESKLFDYVQGHDNAAGYGIYKNKLDSFHKYANEKLKDIDFNESVYDVNFIRNGSDSDIEFIIKDIDKYEGIWGTNVPEPLIYIKNIKVNSSNIQIMGKNKDTVKITYCGIAYMKFHAKDMIKELEGKEEINLEVIGRGNLNKWGGLETPQIFIDSYSLINDMLIF